MALAISFWILAIIAVLSALCVVTLRNVFRCALSLILCFLAVAGIYITLQADFLAAAQVLVYIGAISILIIIAIMLTRDVAEASTSNRLVIPAIIAGVLFFATVTYAVANTPWQIATTAPAPTTTATIGDKLFGSGGFILPVEIAPVLLLAALIGAIVLVREK